MFDFAEITNDMSEIEILNYYRNLYYTEPQVTERGIVANAINDMFDLINRQKLEIERLRAKVETRTQEKLALGRIYTQKLKTVKYETYYEAYKEFAERIRECCDLNNDLSTDAWLSVTADIDCVLKEMSGEQ